MSSDAGLERVNCPCCGADSYSPWAEENGFSAVKCDVCGAVYVAIRPNENCISAAARDGVHQFDGGVLDQRYGRRAWKVPYYSRVLKRFFTGQEKLRWLDVGAGYGEFAEAVMKAIPQAEVYGIEPMSVKVSAAQSRGLPVWEKTLGDVDGQYDVISLINVFSHIPDFSWFASKIVSLMAPGGSLFLETGNAGDLKKRRDYPGDLLLPDHLVFVGVNQMEHLLTKLGFESIEVFSRRIDHPIWAIKQMAKSFISGKPRIVLPYTRAFRTVFYRARLSTAGQPKLS